MNTLRLWECLSFSLKVCTYLIYSQLSLYGHLFKTDILFWSSHCHFSVILLCFNIVWFQKMLISFSHKSVFMNLHKPVFKERALIYFLLCSRNLLFLNFPSDLCWFLMFILFISRYGNLCWLFLLLWFDLAFFSVEICFNFKVSLIRTIFDSFIKKINQEY